jgi:hypothetical protein
VDAVTNGLRLLLPFAVLAAGDVAAPPRAAALPPIVFVSRVHPETLNGRDFGPPIEIAGRETTVGGSLRLLRRDRSVLTLAGPKNGIFDVQRPMVSFDSTRMVFSGVRERGGMWRIFEVRMDGSGLRQLTPDLRSARIPDDPRRPGENERIFERFGDFSPAYLPDGRIVFSSSRYPSLSPSTGERALNLYVMDADGGNLHRITNCRSGAIDPYVMADGRIVFGLWKDNINLPSLYTRGLQPVDPTGNSQGGAFRPWAVNPDGSSADRLGYMGGLLAHGRGGGLHFREMPNGEIVYTRRAKQDLTGPTLATSIAKFRPGDGRDNTTAGLGDPVNLEAPHAAFHPAPEDGGVPPGQGDRQHRGGQGLPHQAGCRGEGRAQARAGLGLGLASRHRLRRLQDRGREPDVPAGFQARGGGLRPDEPGLSTLNGIDRTRAPVASKIALAIAGATAMIGVSPAPAGSRSLRSSRMISIFGTSRKRGTR